MEPTARQSLPTLPIPAPDSGLNHNAFAALLEAAGEVWRKPLKLDHYGLGPSRNAYWLRPDETTIVEWRGEESELFEALLQMLLHHREQIGAAVAASKASCPPGTAGRQQKLLDLLLKGVLEGAAKRAVIDALLSDLGVRVEAPTPTPAPQGPPPELLALVRELHGLWGRNGQHRAAVAGNGDRLLAARDGGPVLHFHGGDISSCAGSLFVRLLDLVFATWGDPGEEPTS